MKLLKRFFSSRKPMAIYIDAQIEMKKKPRRAAKKFQAIDHLIAVNWPFFL